MSRPAPLVVAVEGPSDSGKSTLMDGLAEEFGNSIVLPCYVDIAGGDNKVPGVLSGSCEETIRRFRGFLELERRRVEVLADAEADLVLMDRSIHTLLAHVHAEDQLLNRAALEECRSLAKESAAVWPEAVLFLQVSEEARAHRMDPNDAGQWFTSREFNAAFSAYFLRDHGRAVRCDLIIVNGDLDIDSVLRRARGEIRGLLERAGS